MLLRFCEIYVKVVLQVILIIISFLLRGNGRKNKMAKRCELKVSGHCVEQVAAVAFKNYEFDYKNLHALVMESSEKAVYDDGMLVSYCDNLIDDLRKSNFRDPAKISRIIDLLSIVRDPNIRAKAVEGNCGEMMYAVVKGMAKSLEKRNKSKIFHCCNELDYEQVSKAIGEGDIELMKVFMRFGVCLSPTPPATMIKATKSEDKSKESTNQEKIAEKSEKKYDDTPESASVLEFHKCNINVCSCRTYILKDESRRSLLVAGAFHSSLKRQRRKANESNGKDQFTCIQLYLQAISDPYITNDEVKDLVNAGKRERDTQYWKEVLEAFKNRHPEFEIQLQPRSLVHLCRCAIRTELKKIGSLPYLVTKLEIPHTLKRRLLSDNEDFIV